MFIERTEGWPVGVYLASLGWRYDVEVSDAPGGVTGDDAYIADYFRDELLALVPADTVTFLLRTAVLDHPPEPVTVRPQAHPRLRGELGAGEGRREPDVCPSGEGVAGAIAVGKRRWATRSKIRSAPCRDRVRHDCRDRMPRRCCPRGAHWPNDESTAAAQAAQRGQAVAAQPAHRPGIAAADPAADAELAQRRGEEGVAQGRPTLVKARKLTEASYATLVAYVEAWSVYRVIYKRWLINEASSRELKDARQEWRAMARTLMITPVDDAALVAAVDAAPSEFDPFA